MQERDAVTGAPLEDVTFVVKTSLSEYVTNNGGSISSNGDEWEIVKNCHEAIVSKEQWDWVQKLIDHCPTIMQGNSCPFYNLFHGLVYCAPCGKTM